MRLSEIVIKEIKRGKSPKYAESSDIQVFAQKCNVKTGGINMSLAKFLDAAAFEKYPIEEYMQNNDIVINSTGNGTLGRIGIFHDSDRISDATIVPDSHVTVIRAVHSVSIDYVYYILKYYQPFLESLGEGSTNQTELKPTVISQLFFPLPPIGEQKRIADKLVSLMPFIDKYHSKEYALSHLNKEFPEVLKKSILQEAAMGKLVPQDENDEPASLLLERIRKEKQRLIAEGKLKKDKHESIIYRRDNSHYEKINGLDVCIDDVIPYDIPDNWCWCKIKNIFNLQAGKNIQASQIHDLSDGDDYPCYGGNGIRGYVKNNNHDGDYPIIGRQGALCGNINRAIGKFYATEHAVCVDTFANTDVSWACLFLTALNLNQYATATAQPGLAVANINEVLIPLPPLNEQKRIVAVAKEVFSVIETL